MTEQPAAPWRTIYNDLKHQIDAGQLKPGEQLPSTPQLQEQYAHLSPTGTLSVGPVRRAIHTLQAQGYLRTWPGLGVYVAENPPV